MEKFTVVLVCATMLLLACNKETPVIPPLPPDSSSPTFDFEFVSVASAIKFIPFGDSLPTKLLNKGYEIQLSDTNESILAACPGIVTAIIPDTTLAGGSLITIKFKRNSIYSVTYGGVSNVRVNVNDSILGGSILGKLSRSGIVDFQIVTNGNEALCPGNFGSPGFNQAITQAMVSYNTRLGVDSLTTPCIATSLPL